jgi:hypothetical protein
MSRALRMRLMSVSFFAVLNLKFLHELASQMIGTSNSPH